MPEPAHPGVPRSHLKWLPTSTVAVVVMVTGAALLVGFGTKAPCLAPWHNGVITRYCYSDIQSLFEQRLLGRHIFPYVHGGYLVSPTGTVFLGRGEIEYPVLTGLFAWVAALPIASHDGFLITNVLMLAPLGLLSALLLARMSGRRALLFAAAPGVVLYGFINWDLLSVGLAVLGIYLWWRQRPYLAALAFAAGGCVKLWPALFLVPLVADLVARGRHTQAWRAGAVAAAFILGVNLPFIVANLKGWYAPFVFQASVRIDAPGSTIWDWDGHFLSTGVVNALSWLLTALGCAAVARAGWRRSRHDGAFPFVQTGAAMVFWYLVMAKDNSPQYVLWVLPLFALVKLKPQLWVQLCAISCLLYLFFFDVLVGDVLYVVGAWQAAVFLLAMVYSLRSASVFDESLPREWAEGPVGLSAAGVPA